MLAGATTVVTVVAVLASALLIEWARHVALPTGRGISASEVLEDVVPGGLNALLLGCLALVLLTAGARGPEARRR